VSESFDQLRSDLLRLPVKQRAELAHILILSLDGGIDVDAEPAWDAELARRTEQIERGEAHGEPAETVFARPREKHR